MEAGRAEEGGWGRIPAGWGVSFVAVATFRRCSEPLSLLQAGPEGICSRNSGVSVHLGPLSASFSESLLCKHRRGRVAGAFLPDLEPFELTASWPRAGLGRF